MPNPAAANVLAGRPVVTGGVLSAPLGTALPTATAVALNAAFEAHGYVAEAGLTKSESRDRSSIKEWGGVTVKSSQTGYEATFAFGFLEYLGAGPARVIYGDSAVTVQAANTTSGERVTVAVKGTDSPRRAWVFDMADGDARLRIVLPDAQITEVGDTTFAPGDGALRDVTLTAYPDANGVLFYEYSDNGKKTTA